jgi:hypothetical protein
MCRLFGTKEKRNYHKRDLKPSRWAEIREKYRCVDGIYLYYIYNKCVFESIHNMMTPFKIRLLVCDGSGYDRAIKLDRTASRIGERKTFGDKKFKDVFHLQIFATRCFVITDMNWDQQASGDRSS